MRAGCRTCLYQPEPAKGGNFLWLGTYYALLHDIGPLRVTMRLTRQRRLVRIDC